MTVAAALADERSGEKETWLQGLSHLQWPYESHNDSIKGGTAKWC